MTILFDWLENWHPELEDWESEFEHDPLALHTHNHETELTDPELHVPHDAPAWVGVEEYGQQRHRSRYNERFGHITGPYLADLDVDEFMAEVADLLDFWGNTYGLGDDDREQLRNRAKRMKHQGDHRDVDILETLIHTVTSGGQITA
ncbi:hypothetical protein C481_21166 [Natrialba asiatica DSM 12278]|uniref:Uncharacterized protein n=1 Tax=Natrialba asiatica (strain ATCC 700177 / DSM 12278 / JCM 9576 / FERM P-10747 / NBRC 102637 / 172P1) TaxID=29540 RepID=M0AEH4_NATA1|nr:hypothetical protein C481_21166 [Natrialba asiatica DSM 12278]